jgi:hypothetical protein
METRRDFIKTSTAGLLGAGAMSSISLLEAGEPAKSPSPHFIFLRKGNGTFPSCLVPASLSEAEKKKEEAKEALDLDLTKLDLQDWMAPLNPYKKNMTPAGLVGQDVYDGPLHIPVASGRLQVR